MASLVADYGISSGSDDDSDSPRQGDVTEKKSAEGPTSKVNYFDGKDDTDSEEDDEGDVTTAAASDTAAWVETRLPNPFGDLRSGSEMKSLRSPALAGPGSDSDITGRVFLTQYTIAESNRTTVLEQHVKMTEVQETRKTSRKVCYMFQRGDCRRGKKCKYSHGNPVIPRAAAEEEETADSGNQDNHSYYGNQGGAAAGNQGGEEEEEEGRSRKKRAGVTDNLAVAKRAKRPLESERHKDRPWTVKN